MNFNIIPRHKIDFRISDYKILTDIFRKPVKHKNKFSKKLKDIFKKDIILSSSFRALFYNTLLFLKDNGAEKILFPSKCFYPLYLTAKKLDFDIEIYNIDENYDFNESDIIDYLKNNSSDIFLLSHEFGKYRELSDNLIRTLKEKNIIIIEDQAHSLANFIITGDISFFSFGTGKDVFALSGGAVAFDKEIFRDLYNELQREIKPAQRWDNLVNIKQTMPEVVFSSFPFYNIFVFPVFYFINIISRKLLEKIFFSDDTFVTKNMREFTLLQEKIAVSQFNRLKNKIKKRKKIGNLYNRYLNIPLLKNNTFLAAAFKCNSQKQCLKLLRDLMISGIDCRLNYIKDLNQKNTKEKIIYFPSFSSLMDKDIKNICYKANIILKKFRNI